MTQALPPTPHTLSNFVRALLHPQKRRTCKQCGEQWLVPRWSSNYHAVGENVASEATSEEAARDEDRLKEFQRCPRCGAEHQYRQRRTWFVGPGLNTIEE